MDQVLLQRIKHKDQNAFEELYQQYGGYALRVASAVTGSHAAAADAVQEAFIRVYFNIDSFDMDKPFVPWFYRILINECNRFMKKQSRVTYIGEYLDTGNTAVEDKYEFEEYEDLYRALQSLDSINRIPIVLKYLQGLKEAEIAEILGININTLKSRLFKGRQKLKKQLKNHEERGSENAEYQL